MGNALDSAYLWGITPLNRGNLSREQREGLFALAPQSGFGLQAAPRPAPLDPYSNLPTPGFSQDVAQRFAWTPEAVLAGVREGAATGSWGGLGQPGQLEVARPGEGPGGAAGPYFDPNFPYESLLALRDSLVPKVQEGAQRAMQARGMGYSGIGKYASEDALGYLDRIAPRVSAPQALAMDLERLYGPDIVNSLTLGSTHHGGIGDTVIPPLMPPGVMPFLGGRHVSEAALLHNPAYVDWPSGPPSDAAPSTPGGPGLRPLDGGAPGQGQQPWERPYEPRWGLYDFAMDRYYPTPGYWYDPGRQPDASRMPWLAQAQYPSAASPASRTAP